MSQPSAHEITRCLLYAEAFAESAAKLGLLRPSAAVAVAIQDLSIRAVQLTVEHGFTSLPGGFAHTHRTGEDLTPTLIFERAIELLDYVQDQERRRA